MQVYKLLYEAMFFSNCLHLWQQSHQKIIHPLSRISLSAVTVEIWNYIWPPRKSNDLFQYHSNVILKKKNLPELFCPPILELQRSLKGCVNFCFFSISYTRCTTVTGTITNQMGLLVGKDLQGLSTPSQSCQ